MSQGYNVDFSSTGTITYESGRDKAAMLDQVGWSGAVFLTSFFRCK